MGRPSDRLRRPLAVTRPHTPARAAFVAATSAIRALAASSDGIDPYPQCSRSEGKASADQQDHHGNTGASTTVPRRTTSNNSQCNSTTILTPATLADCARSPNALQPQHLMQCAQQPQIMAEAAALVGRQPPGVQEYAQAELTGLPGNVVLLAVALCCYRRGAGGRQAGPDPSENPRIDPKRAARILANRKSAGISKIRKKIVLLATEAKSQGLWMQQPPQPPESYGSNAAADAPTDILVDAAADADGAVVAGVPAPAVGAAATAAACQMAGMDAASPPESHTLADSTGSAATVTASAVTYAMQQSQMLPAQPVAVAAAADCWEELLGDVTTHCDTEAAAATVAMAWSPAAAAAAPAEGPTRQGFSGVPAVPVAQCLADGGTEQQLLPWQPPQLGTRPQTGNGLVNPAAAATASVVAMRSPSTASVETSSSMSRRIRPTASGLLGAGKGRINKLHKTRQIDQLEQALGVAELELLQLKQVMVAQLLTPPGPAAVAATGIKHSGVSGSSSHSTAEQQLRNAAPASTSTQQDSCQPLPPILCTNAWGSQSARHTTSMGLSGGDSAPSSKQQQQHEVLRPQALMDLQEAASGLRAVHQPSCDPAMATLMHDGSAAAGHSYQPLAMHAAAAAAAVAAPATTGAEHSVTMVTGVSGPEPGLLWHVPPAHSMQHALGFGAHTQGHDTPEQQLSLQCQQVTYPTAAGAWGPIAPQQLQGMDNTVVLAGARDAAAGATTVASSMAPLDHAGFFGMPATGLQLQLLTHEAPGQKHEPCFAAVEPMVVCTQLAVSAAGGDAAAVGGNPALAPAASWEQQQDEFQELQELEEVPSPSPTDVCDDVNWFDDVMFTLLDAEPSNI